MKKNLSVLIYEKNEYLNSILCEQILKTRDYKPIAFYDQKELFELVKQNKFDICLLNIEDILTTLQNFLEVFIELNNHNNIIGYHNEINNNLIIKNFKIDLLPKPFKFKTLLSKFELIKLNMSANKNKFLMKHLEFSPNKKTISNLKTQDTLHLTEKENKLLNYLYNKKDLELTRNELLINIWGFAEDINTHTLETHIYRLKQKLYKLEPNISFSLINNNGIYYIKYK